MNTERGESGGTSVSIASLRFNAGLKALPAPKTLRNR